MEELPHIALTYDPPKLRVTISGAWQVEHQRHIEQLLEDLRYQLKEITHVTFDFQNLTLCDSVSAFLLQFLFLDLREQGKILQMEHLKAQEKFLFSQIENQSLHVAPSPELPPLLFQTFAVLGEISENTWKEMVEALTLLGQVAFITSKLLLRQTSFRFTSFIAHIENFAYRSIPIILLINFLVGCIVAQQGLFQLARFGAEAFAINFVGILSLRELGVLLTSIMIAGRSGSAITAEIGSMKMREEIDALKVLGMNPLEVLILPRILAMLVALPLLTFMADMAALFGGLLVVWTYGDISPTIYLSRLQAIIGLNTFLVGLIKAPFMGLMIGIIAASEGFCVEGSAESLGRHVTKSVVKAISMVIVMDGLFAIFFAAVGY